MAQASTEFGRSAQSVSGVLARVAEWRKSYTAARELRRDYVKTMEELNKLTDRELHDINISRWNIPQIAREAVYGEK